MTPSKSKPILFLLSLVVLVIVIFGCNNSDSTEPETVKKSSPGLVGSWQQTTFGKEQVLDVVKITFSEHTLTMDAPGCLIIGDYTTADGILTFTITSTQGERCAKDQAIGKSDNVHFTVTDSQLILTPLLAGEERQIAYKRVDESNS